MGELFDGNPVTLARTLKAGGFDALFDFPFYYAATDVFCRDQPVGRLADVLFSDRLYPRTDALVTLLDNHDLPRVLSSCQGGIERVRPALTFQLSARGRPSVTYGTEVGLVGAKEPENRGDMVFGAHPLAEHMRRLLKVRARHASLRQGASRLLEVEDTFLVYARFASDELAVIVLNWGRTDRGVELPLELANAGPAVDVLSGSAVDLADFAVPARSVRVVVARLPEAGEDWLSRASPARQVLFVVSALPAEAANTIFVVGTQPELGGWNIDAAPAVKIAPGADATDVAELFTRLPVAGLYAYKLAAKDARGLVRWEAGGNRYLFVRDEPGAARVEVAWRR